MSHCSYISVESQNPELLKIVAYDDSRHSRVNTEGMTLSQVKGRNPNWRYDVADEMPADPFDPFTSLISRRNAQALFDALHKHGFRPTGEKTTVAPVIKPPEDYQVPSDSAVGMGFDAGRVAAMQEHLADLRRLVFERPKPQPDGPHNFD